MEQTQGGLSPEHGQSLYPHNLHAGLDGVDQAQHWYVAFTGKWTCRGHVQTTLAHTSVRLQAALDPQTNLAVLQQGGSFGTSLGSSCQGLGTSSWCRLQVDACWLCSLHGAWGGALHTLPAQRRADWQAKSSRHHSTCGWHRCGELSRLVLGALALKGAGGAVCAEDFCLQAVALIEAGGSFQDPGLVLGTVVSTILFFANLRRTVDVGKSLLLTLASSSIAVQGSRLALIAWHAT